MTDEDKKNLSEEANALLDKVTDVMVGSTHAACALMLGSLIELLRDVASNKSEKDAVDVLIQLGQKAGRAMVAADRNPLISRDPPAAPGKLAN